MRLEDALEIAAATDPGVVRSHNEDAVDADASLGLAILADGMGGYNAGEVASGMATTLLATELERHIRSEQAHGEPAADWPEVLLREEIKRANSAIYQAAQSQSQYAGMGTTLVVAQFHDSQLTVAHVGDSRLYRLRDGQLNQLTRDHSLLQEQIDSGLLTPEQAKLSLNKNLVTRAIGVDPDVEPEIHRYDVAVDDIYLLCSDGLHDMMGDEDIALVMTSLAGNLELAASQLIDMANDNGGRDNVSVILIRVRGDFAEARGLLARIRRWLGTLS